MVERRAELLGLAEDVFLDEEKIGGSAFSDHEIRIAKFKAKQAGKKWRKPRAKLTGEARWRDHPLAYLLVWYRELRAQTPAAFGAQPVEYAAIAAFRDLYGLDLDAFDVETLIHLDWAWRKSRAKHDEANKTKGGSR